MSRRQLDCRAVQQHEIARHRDDRGKETMGLAAVLIPEQMVQAFNIDLDLVLRRSTLDAQGLQSLHNLLNVADTHRDVEPVWIISVSNSRVMRARHGLLRSAPCIVGGEPCSTISRLR